MTEQTQRMWEADLTEPGRKLTAEELVALESIHACQNSQQLCEALKQQTDSLVFMLMHLRSIEGRMDRLEQYLQRIDARYPRSGEVDVGLVLVPGRGR